VDSSWLLAAQCFLLTRLFFSCRGQVLFNDASVSVRSLHVFADTSAEMQRWLSAVQKAAASR
jgi:hypothetical protein